MSASPPGRGLDELYAAARREIAKVIVGQDDLIEHVLVSLFAGGHVLIEGVPGTAKTLLIRVIARLFSCEFKRVQFTPDLMPADITGTNVFDPRDQSFHFRSGPVFAQLVLGDEINLPATGERLRLRQRFRGIDGSDRTTREGISRGSMPQVLAGGVAVSQSRVRRRGGGVSRLPGSRG